MANWTIITDDHVKAAGYGFIVDKARTASVGGVDPMGYEVGAAVARVRRCVAAGGNALDVDTAKVPMSLLSLTVHLVLWGLMMRLRLPMNDDQKEQRRIDEAELKAIATRDNAVPVEEPDEAAGNAEMGQPQSSPRVIGRSRYFTRETEDGL